MMNKITLTLGTCCIFTFMPCMAEVITDGTVGPAQDLAGPDFSIGQNLGTLSGANLFHSFSHFNLDNSQSATFTGDAAIQNVISRVTGGEISSIYGVLKSEIGQAAVYFINPAGVVFGQNAQVDVPGAFYVSTANELQFADGGKFSASNPQASILSMAAPAAFGFLGKQIGELKLDGVNLKFRAGKTVQLSANKITIDQTKITQTENNPNADGIGLQLVTVGNAPQTLGIQTLPDDAMQGELTLRNTTLDVSGNGGGRFSVRAGNVDAADSTVSARNTGDKDASATQGVDINGGNITLDNTKLTTNALSGGKAGTVMVSAQNKLAVVNGGQIFSGTYAIGDAGSINVKAGTILIDGQKSTAPTVIGSLARANSSGKTGSVLVTAQNELTLMNGGGITSSTLGLGDAGEVDIKAGSIKISGNGGEFRGGVSSNTVGDNSKAKAGMVKIIAQRELTLTDGGIISASTAASGAGGIVDINAETIHIDKGIITSEASKGSSGKAGSVKVTAQKELVVANGGKISSDTFSVGDAGEVSVKAGTIQIDGQGRRFDTGIFSDAKDSSGNAGIVTVTAQNELAVINGGEISSNTYAKGNAGEVNVSAGTIRIDGKGVVTSIISDAQVNSIGNSGRVKITAQNGLAVINGGQISSSTFSKGDAGSVDIEAETITVDGQGKNTLIISSTEDKNSSGKAGTVAINAQKELAVLNGGVISSTTFSKGNAGNVDIKTGTLRIDGQGSTARIVSTAEKGSGGNAGIVNVTAQNGLAVLNGGHISSGTYGTGDAGSVNVKAESVKIDGQESKYVAGIFSTAEKDSKGNAGAVVVTAQNELAVVNGGTISSSTAATGDAGSVDVKAETIKIDGQNSPYNTGILSVAGEVSGGKAGSVTVTASKALQINQGQINIRSNVYAANPAEIQQNTITVTAPEIKLTNNSKIDAASTGNIPASAIQINTHQLTVKGNSQITTSANQGNGGPISINANDWLFLNNSQITTSVTGKDNGNGGDITLNGDVLVMDSGFIQANTAAPQASGGDINLNIKQLVYSQDNLQRGGSTPLTFIPNSGLNVIQAASPTGVNGNINITAPQLNIVGALVGLNNPELDLSRVGHDPCSDTVRQSTLKRSGKGGVPLFNKGQDGYTLEHLLETKPGAAAGTQQATHTPNAQQDCKPKLADKPLQQALTY